uniref:Uncharacterized protein n=1 Tax=Ditylenchus dipsaci TaxID=166011 RepID=A0A915CLS7_9BILA
MHYIRQGIEINRRIRGFNGLDIPTDKSQVLCSEQDSRKLVEQMANYGEKRRRNIGCALVATTSCVAKFAFDWSGGRHFRCARLALSGSGQSWSRNDSWSSRRRCSCSSRLHEDSYRWHSNGHTKTAIGGIQMDNTKTAMGGIPFDNTKTAIGGIPMDNTKTAIGGIPFDNTKTAIGGIPMDNTKTAIGGISFDNTKTAIGGIPFDNTKTAIGGIPMDNTKTAIGAIPLDNTKTAIGGIPFDSYRWHSHGQHKTAIGGIPFDNTKTAIGGIPFDNTKTAIGGIPMDNTKTAIGGIPMDNTRTAIGGIPMDTTKTAIGGMPTGGFGGGAPAPSFTPGAAPSRPAAANQSVYLGAGGGNLGAAQSAYFNLGAAGKPTGAGAAGGGMQQWQSWEIHYIRQGIEINRRIRGFNAIGHTYRQIAGALFRARLPQIGGTDGELWGEAKKKYWMCSCRYDVVRSGQSWSRNDSWSIRTIFRLADNAFLRFISQGRTSKLIDETIWKPLLGNTAPQNLDYPLTYREIYQKKVMDQRQLSEEARRVFAYRLPFNPHFFIHDDNGFMRQPFRQPEPFRPIPSPLDPFGVRIVLPQRPGYQQKQPRIDLLGQYGMTRIKLISLLIQICRKDRNLTHLVKDLRI